jgi:transcriptional regulator with XRE-family HTH domain
VSDDAYGATVAKWRLSRRLAALRAAAGYTASQVCDKLDWGRGKVTRFEANDWKLPEMSDLRDLLRIYGVGEDEQQELLDLARRARLRAWWRKYDDVFTNEFPGYENDAARISVYMPLVLPGLLQSPAYIEASMGVGRKPAAWRERALAARLRRQQVLDRADGTAPRLTAVITEASLLYRWGSAQERRAQLAHLAAMSARPTVELRVLRFAGGNHPGMISQINLFDFPDDQDPGIVYLENDVLIQEVAKQPEVKNYAALFGQIRDAAIAPAATTAYLEQLAQTVE